MEFPGVIERVWSRIMDPKYCEEHCVFWQPTTETNRCPACSLQDEVGAYERQKIEDEESCASEITELNDKIEKLVDKLRKIKEVIEG